MSSRSGTAIKALARASKASRDAARRRGVSLEWNDWNAALPVTDLRQAFPSARRLALPPAAYRSASDQAFEAFLSANGAFLSQLQHLELYGRT